MHIKLTFLLLFSSVAVSLAQVPNNGMELWSQAPLLEEWTTNSIPQTLPPWEPYIVRQDGDAHGGDWCADFWSNGVVKPWATASFDIGTAHPESLRFWYKLAFPPCVNDPGFPEQDTVMVDVELLYNGNMVDSGHWESVVSELDYTLIDVPLSQNANQFNDCRVTITGGSIFGGCGFAMAPTEFRVDDELVYPVGNCIDTAQIDLNMFCITLYDPVCGCDGVTYSNSCYAEFYGGVTSWTGGSCVLTGIADPAAASLFRLFPNPNQGRFRLEPLHAIRGSAKLRLLDLSGRTVLQQAWNRLNGDGMTIDVTLSNGVYLLELESEGQRQLQRMVVTDR